MNHLEKSQILFLDLQSKFHLEYEPDVSLEHFGKKKYFGIFSVTNPGCTCIFMVRTTVLFCNIFLTNNWSLKP